MTQKNGQFHTLSLIGKGRNKHRISFRVRGQFKAELIDVSGHLGAERQAVTTTLTHYHLVK